MKIAQKKPLCLIPARGGSKRLPRKNISLLGGKPLIAWSIDAALNSDLFDTVWISSEDKDILEVAQDWGGTPLPRSLDLAEDKVTIVDLCLQVVEDLNLQNKEYTVLYVLLPTAPFRQSSTIRKAWEAFIQSEADALMSVIPTDHPPQWALTQYDGWLSPLYQREYELSRQDLSVTYRHDGGHAIIKTDRLLADQTFIGSSTLAFPITSRVEAVDINEPLDLLWAEFLLEQGQVKCQTQS